MSKHCGECNFFSHESIDGYGWCDVTGREQRCSDQCTLSRENITDKQREKIEQCAEAVLEARKQFPNSSLADLYDPLAMPPALMKAHQALDKAVDAAYRSAPFTSDSQRMEFLFDLYNKYNAKK